MLKYNFSPSGYKQCLFGKTEENYKENDVQSLKNDLKDFIKSNRQMKK